MEPPPYTEVALEGHLSLMKGHSPVKHSVSREAWAEGDGGHQGELDASLLFQGRHSEEEIATEQRSPLAETHPPISHSSGTTSPEPARASSQPCPANFTRIPDPLSVNLSASMPSSCGGEQVEHPSELCAFPPRRFSRPHSPRPQRRGTHPFLISESNLLSQDNPFPLRPTQRIPPTRENLLVDPNALPSEHSCQLNPLTCCPPLPGSYPQPFFLPPIGSHPLPFHHHHLPPLQSSEQLSLDPKEAARRRRRRREHRKREKTRTWHGVEAGQEETQFLPVMQ